MLLDISSLREKLGNHDISKVSWVDKHFQIADSLTKNLLRVLHSGKLVN